jgi:hypothetical protein
MVDRIIGIAALAVLVAFLGVIVGFVPDVDLAIVIVIVAAMASYDFYLTLFPKRRNK